MADDVFEDPRLAAVYDDLDPDRSDLDVYAAIARELGAGSVLDIGCGTGTFAVLLAGRGIDVLGVDPAQASLDVARAKPGADRVRWVHGDISALPDLQVDLATMTGNVAQVFLTDQDWAATLRGACLALRPGGWLVFETRVPEREAWRAWNRVDSRVSVDIPRVGTVESWADLVEVDADLVSFRGTWAFDRDCAELTSESTLRFRTREQIELSLDAAGFVLHELRGAPDRPGLEWVFLARRPGSS